MQKNNTNQNLVFKYYDIIIIRCILNGGQFNNITQTGFSDFNLTFKKTDWNYLQNKEMFKWSLYIKWFELNYSHGQKYRHPCNSVRKCNTALRKLFQLQMFWHSRAYCFCLHCNNTKKNREEKSNLIKFHTELKNGLDKIIGTLSKLYEIIAFQACDAPVICI